MYVEEELVVKKRKVTKMQEIKVSNGKIVIARNKSMSM